MGSGCRWGFGSARRAAGLAGLEQLPPTLVWMRCWSVPKPKVNYVSVDAAEVKVGDVLHFPPLMLRFEVHAIAREPRVRRFLWRAPLPALITFWSDDRFREETLKWGQEHFLITPGAVHKTVTADSRVPRLSRHPDYFPTP